KSTPYNLEQYRPPMVDGAPGPLCPPELKGGNPDGTVTVGQKLKVDHEDSKKTWSRFDKKDDEVTVLWLRDGAPLPQYMGAPIGSKPECECDAQSSDEYKVQPEDAGHWISALVTAHNVEQDSATNVLIGPML